MLTAKISFKDGANQGSFAINAIAETLGGDWSEKSSTDDFGIVTNIDESEFVKELLDSDPEIESYELTNQ